MDDDIYHVVVVGYTNLMAVVVEESLNTSGFRVPHDVPGRFSGSFKPSLLQARVFVVVVSRHDFYNYTFALFLDYVLRSGKPVIPVFRRCATPTHLQDEVYLKGFVSSRVKNVCRQLSMITAHGLAHCDVGAAQLKHDVLSCVIRVFLGSESPLLKQVEELTTRVQIFTEDVRFSRKMVIQGLKLLAGEFVKDARDKLRQFQPPTASHNGQPSSRFTSIRRYVEVRKVSRWLNVDPRQFAACADRCIDERNKQAHFPNKNWRQHCSNAVQYINRFPDVKAEIPDQCFIIRSYKEICKSILFVETMLISLLAHIRAHGENISG